MKEKSIPVEISLKRSLIISLYIPWVLATILQEAPITSYWISWLGSFFIFYQTWISPNRFVLPDRPIHKQIMRPLFLQQLVFAGFMCCTSIFYFLDVIGFKFDTQINSFFDNDSSYLIAKCQRLSVFGHAAFVTGILIFQNEHLLHKPFFKPIENLSKEVWTIRLAIVTLLLSVFFENIPGLQQFAIGYYNVAIFSGAVLLVKGLIEKDIKYISWGGSIFIVNVLNSTLTGYKEHLILNFLLLACLLFPYFKKTVIIVGIPLFAALLYISPIYSGIIRKQSWSGDATAEEARSEAIETILSEDTESLEDNVDYEFFTQRLSEMSMFIIYADKTPREIPYYGTDIVKNTLLSLIPRALWSNKPVTENLAMERVYAAGVVSRMSNVSAKTRPIVDGYLSAGVLGVFLYMLFLGSISQLLSNKAEILFGGYSIGCIIFYNGFFQPLWRGETMEFIINTVFWSFIGMLILFKILRVTNYLEKIHYPSNTSA